MADAKISQLPVATTPLAGTELVPVVQGGVTDQTTVEAILTGTVPSGTANGVLYLDGSKVVTSGSALTFDGTTLGVNGGLVADTNLLVQINSPAAEQRYFASNKAGAYGLLMGYDTGNDIGRLRVIPNTALTFEVNNSEAMRLDSTGLGIGTNNPGERFVVANSSGSVAAQILASATGTSNLYFADGTTGADSYTGFIQYNHSTNAMSFGTNGGTTRAIISADGNLGLGATPSAWVEGTGLNVGSGRGGSIYTETVNYGFTTFNANAYYSATDTWKYVTGNAASRYQQLNGVHSWHTAASGTAGNTISFTQAMTLDASGNLLVGGTSNDPFGRGFTGTRVVFGNNSGETGLTLRSGAGTASYFEFGTDTTRLFSLSGNASAGTSIKTITSVPLIFGTNDGERARITSGGYFKASDDGTYTSSGSFHEVCQSTDNVGFSIECSNASLTTLGCAYIQADRNTTNNTFYALSYYNVGAAAYKFRVADSGDVTNTNGTYGTISDAKMKTDIVDAGSQWSDIKALRFRKFKMKDDPSGLVQLGVVAQEVEQTSPGLVDEHIDRDQDGNDLGTTTKSVKTSVLLMKAAVALQEAMARIETLEAEVAALKGN